MPSEEAAQAKHDGIFIEKVSVSAMQGLMGIPSEEALQAKMSCRRRSLMHRYLRLTVYYENL